MSRVLVYACLLLALLSYAVSQTGDAKVDAGIKAAEAFINMLSYGDFSKDITKFANLVGPYVSMVGPAIDLISELFGLKGESQELKYMKKMMKYIETRFDRIEDQFQDVKRIINWNTVKIQLEPYETNIRILARELNLFYQSRNKRAVNAHKRSFVNMYKRNYHESAHRIYDHVVSTNRAFSQNLLVEAQKQTQYHRKKMQNFMKLLMKIIITGVEVEMAYYKMALPYLLNKREKIWKNRLHQMQKAMKKADNDIKKKYLYQSRIDIPKLVERMSHSALSKKLFDFLKDKYYWRSWFVVVYDPFRGWEWHCLYICSGYVRFQLHGHNIAVASVPTSSSSNKNKAKAELKNVKINNYNQRADTICNAFPRGSCYKYAAVGVIRNRRYSHVNEMSWKFDSDRCAYLYRKFTYRRWWASSFPMIYFMFVFS